VLLEGKWVVVGNNGWEGAEGDRGTIMGFSKGFIIFLGFFWIGRRELMGLDMKER
jgi:hypothetical protein